MSRSQFSYVRPWTSHVAKQTQFRIHWKQTNKYRKNSTFTNWLVYNNL